MSAFAGAVVLDGGSPEALAGELTATLSGRLEYPGAQPARVSTGPDAVLVHRQSLNCPEDRLEVQPTSSNDGRLMLLFDGRLDNRAELSGQLGRSQRDSSDSSLVLAALERWGAGGCARLRGPFALAAWEAHTRRLILSRDALGERPLFFRRHGGVLQFATLPAPLLATQTTPRVVSTRLVDHILDIPADPTVTLLEGIERVPAATTMVFDGRGAARASVHWSMDWQRVIRLRSDDEYVLAARDVLDRAVHRCLRLSSPVAALLSGGLDSAGVAATAARSGAGLVAALTIVPDERVPFHRPPHAVTHEGALAEATARMHPTMRWQTVDGTAALPTLDDERRAAALGWPHRLEHTAWFFPAHRAAAALGATALLTGEWGNATLTRSGVLGLVNQLRSGQILSVLREHRALARQRSQSHLRGLAGLALNAWAPDRWRTKLGTWRHRRSALSATDVFDAEFLCEQRIWERLADARCLVPGGELEQRQLALTRLQRSQASLSLLRSLHGLDLRNPLMDRDLVEFCLAVPPEQLLRNGINRWLGRRTLADRLPPEVVQNTRRGRQQPEMLYRMARQRDRILDDLDDFERRPSTRAMLNLRAMRELADRWPADYSAAPFWRYWTVLEQGLSIGRFIRAIEERRA